MIARLRNGPVLNLLIVAWIGLLVYYATTLTERGQTERSPSSSSVDGARSFPRSVNAGDADGAGVNDGLGLRRQHGVRTPPGHPRSVNVAYHRSYPVDWRRRYHGEHAHVQRLLDELRRARHVQAHRKSAGGAGGAGATTIGWPWVAIADCESGDGDGQPPYTADWTYNGSSGFDGGVQFEPDTWSSYRRAGDPEYAYEASPDVQLAVAERVLADQGWRAWPACSRKVGLR